MKHGKKYEAALKLIDKNKVYSVHEACELVKQTSVTKFDSTVGVSMKLNINTKKADQQVRGTVILPAGTGKDVRVVAITSKVDVAKEAGADYAGGKELLEKIVGEKWFDFDVMCATPEMMGEIGKNGRVLGPKGLMPNPKTGTVSVDIKKAIEEIKAGKVEYRTDKEGNVHVSVARISFDDQKIIDNLKALCDTIVRIRPSAVKGIYIKNAVIHTTMGPAIKITFAGR